jgi:hypothetical protein
MITFIVRPDLTPRIGRNLAFSRPWSASQPLFAYFVVSWNAAGASSSITAG